MQNSNRRDLCIFIPAILVFMAVMIFGHEKAQGEAVYIIPPAAATSTAQLRSQTVRSPGDIVAKPVCTSGTAYIFVYPVYMVGGITSNIYAITGISTFAVDNGNGTWTVRAQVKDARNSLWENPLAIKTITQIWCCANADCS